MDQISVIFPEETKKYLNLQCNDKKEEFSRLSEIGEIEEYLKRTPKVALDVGSGIGRASVFFFKYYNWTDTLFILADGDSGEEQLSGMRTGKADFYNSLKATISYCRVNGMSKFMTFNLEELRWGELPYKPDLVYSFRALGFHWPVDSFLEEIYPSLKDRCLLIFELRGGAIAKDWIGRQVKRIDYKKYQIKRLVFEPGKKKGNFIVLEKI